ncbi:MAG: hypothetical protein L0Y48_04675 [Fusobacteria bacterium]|nr:hypothetical protein [Fusobacteriota bacterium]
MNIDNFIADIDVKAFSLKETIGMYALYKREKDESEGITLIEIINVQTAYIDKLRNLFVAE